MSSQIKIRVNELIGKENISNWSDELVDHGINIEIVEFQNEPIMALEWLLPTGIVLYLTKTYFDTILKEAAKDHYQIFKKIISKKIYPKYIGETGKKIVSIDVNGKPKEPSFFSRTFSFSTSLQSDKGELELKLLIPENASCNDVELAFLKFGKFIIKHDEITLSQELIAFDKNRLWAKALWLNPESQTIEIIDVVQSSKSKKVVTSPLENLITKNET